MFERLYKMVEVFVPNGYCSKTFWPPSDNQNEVDEIKETITSSQQPFSVYHLSQPHLRRIKNDHLGASPLCRASASKSMQLLRKVLQPAINHDIVKVFEKYILVFREAAENACENMNTEPFSTTPPSLNVNSMVADICQDALNSAKSLFYAKDYNRERKQNTYDNVSSSKNVNSNVSHHLLPNGKRRVASPDFPWNKRLKDEEDFINQRRSLSPVPKKRFKASTPVITLRRYGSPHRNSRESIRRKIEKWNPSRLTTETEFVMGTKANKALGLGATRGRIYMKHPDLFKYSGDHDDKKWMVKNNCMAATGGKNTFLMLAEDVMHLYDTEYKDSPGTMSEELHFFKLPEFVLEKMRTAMINDKKLRLRQLAAGNSPTRESNSAKDAPTISHSYKSLSVQKTVRQAAQVAAAAINAASDSPDDQQDSLASISTATSVPLRDRSNHLDTDSEINELSDEDM